MGLRIERMDHRGEPVDAAAGRARLDVIRAWNEAGHLVLSSAVGRYLRVLVAALADSDPRRRNGALGVVEDSAFDGALGNCGCAAGKH